MKGESKMTKEKKARLKELQDLHSLAFNAVKYLNKKAEECQEETRRKLFIELAETADIEAEKYFAEAKPLQDEEWEDFVKNNSNNPYLKSQLEELSA